MPFEPIFENISLSSKTCALTNKIKTEAKTDVLTEDVAKILNVSAVSQVESKEVSDGKIVCNGKVVFFVCYENIQGEILKTETKSEFSTELKCDDVNKTCKGVVYSEVEKTDADATGVKLCLSATVSLTGEVYGCSELPVLSGGDGLICADDELSYTTGLGVKESVYPIEEEFELNCIIKEVLSQRAQAVVTSCQCGVGCIIVDGEVFLSAILLQNDKKADIIRKNEKLPFRMEIECEEAMPAFGATAKVSVKSFKTDVTVDENKSVSLVNCNVILLFEGEAFATKSVNVIKDAFCKSKEIKLHKEDFTYYKPCDLRTETVKVFGPSTVSELPVGAMSLACSGEKFEIASVSKTDKGLTVTGALSMNGYFLEADDKIFTRKTETPVETTIELPSEDTEFEIKAVATSPELRIISLTETEIQSQVVFTLYPKQKQSFNYVKQIEDCGDKRENKSAISVYIPTEGEELWSLSKRLNVSPEELVSTNPELQFPLSGTERIVIYRQKQG